MSIANPYSQYMENQFKTATPGKLIVMAYDAAIRFARAAAEKMKEGRLDEQSANIIKVQHIVLELISSLNFHADSRLADNLEGLYSYVFDRLTYANTRDDQAALEEAIRILSDMRSVWAEAELLVRSGKTSLEAKAA